MPQRPDLRSLDDGELAATARSAIAELATRGSHDAFALLLDIATLTGEQLGVAARAVAATGSWSQVADVTGTTKQAAWERWRQ